jgi:hypothetical protein
MIHKLFHVGVSFNKIAVYYSHYLNTSPPYIITKCLLNVIP